jgi:hypothetical protein
MKIAKWWADVQLQTQSFDADDHFYWTYGPTDEDEYVLALARGEDVNGHSYSMPEWLRRQKHFENLVCVLTIRFKYFVAGFWCQVVGHECEVEEGGPECPWVSWVCTRCGAGGQGWW